MDEKSPISDDGTNQAFKKLEAEPIADDESVESHASSPTRFEAVNAGLSRRSTNQSQSYSLKEHLSASALYKTLSRNKTGNASDYDTSNEELQEIDRLLTQMFGKERREHSQEEKSRHVGVIFKHLTVKGMGLGAAIQPTVGSPAHAIWGLLTKGPRGASPKVPIRTLIDDFSGCVKPGEMLLVLGRPGSGCSTFLKVLANQRFGYEKVEGEVSYGGAESGTMEKRYRGEILYNPEDDLHYATLKVKDTLSFALTTRTPGKESRSEGESRKDYIDIFLKMVSKLFWIQHTMDTKVGDEFVRGVSGGEKKRVSIAEAMITKASVQAWDNSTRGLDASTAREYVESLRVLTSKAHISTAAALYQVGESLYELFDKVILIEGGRCAYFGPTDKAAQYFKDLGFIQPDRWTTADFLTSVSDEHERHIQPGCENRIPRSAAQFGDTFAKSDVAKQNIFEIEEFEAETKALVAGRDANTDIQMPKKKNYTIPYHKQVLACVNRQAKVMLGDPQSLYGKWVIITFQSLIVGSLFYNLQPTSAGVFPRGGVLFFMLLFNALLALAELTAAFQSRPILLKHKSFSFYRPSAYALAQTVIDAPLVLVQVFIFDIVVYFMANLQRTASQFFVSLLFLWILTMTMYAFFRAIGAVSSSLDAATRVTGVSIQALIVYTGYLIPPAKMKPWLSWLRWINPVQYGFEALLANEFRTLDIQCEPPFLVPQGPDASPQYQSCTIQGSTPGTTIVKGSDYIATAYQYSYSHVWRNFGIIIAFFLFFVAVTAIGLEFQKPNKGGGAVTIFKRGQAPSSVQKALENPDAKEDEETGKAETFISSDNDDSMQAGKGIAGNETVFTWQNVKYTIPTSSGPRKLLQDQQGYVRPGKLTALMGASGAGKTTLLNTLAQRITFGVVEGDFLVDGKPLPRSFQRSSGFAEQMDVHEPTATIREALQFSAKLRQPREVSLEEKYAYVENVIDLLEMRDIAGATVGVTGTGLNQEQRKRLTIGVELASKPELLMFLDEPTSGLDSGAAFNIIRLLKKLAAAGQAILCTIHQPSSVLFENFDKLVLLQAGGRIVYHGELGHDSRTLLDYLERNGAHRCPPKANPAEYMLEAIGAGNPDYKGPNWGDIWAQSGEKEERSQEIQRMVHDRRAATSEGTQDDREYAMPLSTQISTVIHRHFTAYWRMPEYIMGKIILHIFTGLFNTFTFWMVGNSSIDMQSRLFSIFMTLTISPPLIQQLQPKFLHFRDLFKARESKSKIYSWVAFAIAAVLTEIPYSIFAGTLYWCTWYWGVGFPTDTYTSAVIWLFVMLFELFYVSFGQAIAAFSPNELLASLLVPVFFTFVVSFCGVVQPPTSLPSFWRTWMYPLTPFRYLVEGLLGLVIHDVPVVCDTNELATFSHPPGSNCSAYAGPYAKEAGGYVETLPNGMCGYCQYRTGDDFGRSFGVYYDNHWRDFGLMCKFALLLLCNHKANPGRRVYLVQYIHRVCGHVALSSGWPSYIQCCQSESSA